MVGKPICDDPDHQVLGLVNQHGTCLICEVVKERAAARTSGSSADNGSFQSSQGSEHRVVVRPPCWVGPRGVL